MDKYDFRKEAEEKPVEFLNRLPAELIRQKMSKYLSTPDDNGCVRWIGPTNTSSGYGILNIGSARVPAHRAAWVALNGPIDPSLDACHKCDNRWCVSADHIFPGTRSENMVDATNKKRIAYFVHPDKMPYGIRHGHAKVNEGIVRAMRASGKTAWALAKEYGLHPKTCADILTRETWAHVK